MESWLAALSSVPAFWTFAAAIMTGLMTALVALSASRRAARTTEKKDALTANQDLQNSVNTSLKMFTDTMQQALASERLERAAMAVDLKSLQRKMNLALAYIFSLERRLVAIGEALPPRPDGID